MLGIIIFKDKELLDRETSECQSKKEINK